MTFLEMCERLSPGLNDFQKAMLSASASINDTADAFRRMAIAARGISKPRVVQETLYKTVCWYSAPARVKHLAKHAKKARVRKKNLRRIFGK